MIMRTRGTGWEIPRLLFLLVSTSLGWGVIGIGLLVGGLIWGFNSHQASYQNYPVSSHYHISTGTVSGNVYINADESNEYFAAFTYDFNPNIDAADIDKTAAVSFIARTDTSTLSPHLNVNSTTTIYSAHKIEKLVLYDLYGHIINTYASTEYNANPHEYNANYWPYASILLLVGTLCAGNGIFFFAHGKQRRKQTAADELARLEAIPSPFARELGQMPSVQTYYQGVEQYPQPYTQAYNPYQAPQE